MNTYEIEQKKWQDAIDDGTAFDDRLTGRQAVRLIKDGHCQPKIT